MTNEGGDDAPDLVGEGDDNEDDDSSSDGDIPTLEGDFQ